MTIVELTPAEIYSLHVMAMLNVGFCVLILREFYKTELRKERFMLLGALFVLIGLPIIVAARVMFT